MNKFLEFFKGIFGLTDEQLEKAQLEFENKEPNEEVEKAEHKDEEKEEDKEEDKEEEHTKEEPNNKGGEADMKELELLKEQVAKLTEMLEQKDKEAMQKARQDKIKSVKGCNDYDVLETLLKDVKDDDIDSKVEEIKKEKGYLFKKINTEGFNPAQPQNTLDGVDRAFLELNPGLKLN